MDLLAQREAPGMHRLRLGVHAALGILGRLLGCEQRIVFGRALLVAAVLEAASTLDVDVRREVLPGVVLTGGTSLLAGLRERLERGLIEAAPQAAKIKVVAPTNPVERRFSSWIGGSILSSLGSFHQMWMSKQEYEEHGASLIHRKAP